MTIEAVSQTPTVAKCSDISPRHWPPLFYPGIVFFPARESRYPRPTPTNIACSGYFRASCRVFSKNTLNCSLRKCGRVFATRPKPKGRGFTFLTSFPPCFAVGDKSRGFTISLIAIELGWLRPRFGRRREGVTDRSTGVLLGRRPGLLVIRHISHNSFLIESA